MKRGLHILWRMMGHAIRWLLKGKIGITRARVFNLQAMTIINDILQKKLICCGYITFCYVHFLSTSSSSFILIFLSFTAFLGADKAYQLFCLCCSQNCHQVNLPSLSSLSTSVLKLCDLLCPAPNICPYLFLIPLYFGHPLFGHNSKMDWHWGYR